MTAPRRIAAVVAALVAAIAIGCGGDDGTAGPGQSESAASNRLTGAERELVSDSERTIDLYCRKRALALSDPEKRPTVGLQARAFEAIDDLVALAGRKPGARVRRGVGVRVFVGDLAENLEGSNCDPQIVARLDRGLAELARAP